jgi:hypothetical protein
MTETPGQRSLREVSTGPYLAGRLVGLAISLAAHLADRQHPASCERYAEKLARGGIPAGINAVGMLAGMVSRDIREHRADLPDAYYEAYLDISTRLDDLGATGYPAPWPPASPAAGEFVLGQHHQSAALRRGGSEPERNTTHGDMV